MDYYTIHNSDGDTHVKRWIKEDLEEALEEEYWGPVAYLTELPLNGSDTNYWGNSVLIVKGEITKPIAIQIVVDKFKLE